MQGGEQPEWGQDSPTNRATKVRDISSIAASGLMMGTEEEAFALTTQYPKIMQQSSFISNTSTVKQEPSLFDSFVLGSSSLPIQCPKSSSPGLIQNCPRDNSSSSVHSSQGSQNKQQCMIQKLLEEMMNNNNNNRAKEVHDLNAREEEVSCRINTSTVGGLLKKPRRTSIVRNELGCRGSIAAVASRAYGRDTRSKAASSSSKSSGTTANNCVIKREPDLSVTEGVRKDVAHGFCDNE